MKGDLLLDTHIMLWLDGGDERLLPSTRALIDRCWREGGTIFVSAVSAWEIAVLADRGHVDLDLPVERWVARFFDRPGVVAVPLDHHVAMRAYRLDGLEHRDPGDRFLVATAVGLECPLVTYDERVRRFAGAFGARHGFAVAA